MAANEFPDEFPLCALCLFASLRNSNCAKTQRDKERKEDPEWVSSFRFRVSGADLFSSDLKPETGNSFNFCFWQQLVRIGLGFAAGSRRRKTFFSGRFLLASHL
jgi:hypothetical protein